MGGYDVGGVWCDGAGERRMCCIIVFVLRQGKIASNVRRDVRDQDLQDVPTHVIFLVMQVCVGVEVMRGLC